MDPLAQADRDLSRTVLHTTRVRAIAHNPDLYVLAFEAIPAAEHRGAGRPAAFPDYVWVVFMAMVGAFGSARMAAAAMGDETYWGIVRDGVATCLGPAEALALPTRGPSRNMWNWHSKRLQLHLTAIQDVFRDLAAQQALDAGYADPGIPCGLAEPDREHFAVGDGTVVASPIRGTTKRKAQKARAEAAAKALEGEKQQAAAAGKPEDAPSPDTAASPEVEVVPAVDPPKPKRVDPGAGWHGEGGEEGEDHLVYGPKFVHVSVRSDKPLSRIVLDVRYQPPGGGYGGEAAIAVAMVKDALAQLPGLVGVCWDGAMRGVHRDPLMKLGLLVVSPQHDGIVPRRLDPVTGCRCRARHDLWAKDGAVHGAEILDTGELHHTPCQVVRLEKRGRGGRHRWYHVVRLACGNEHRIRLDATEQDGRTGFNRAEHLRQHPPDSDGYTRTYHWRPDAESLNSTLDATLWNRRMIAYGPAQQTLVMLGFALAQNSLTRYLHQRRPVTDQGSGAQDAA